MRDASALGVDAEMQIQNQPMGCKRTNKDPHNHRDRATRKLSQPPHHDHTCAIHKRITSFLLTARRNDAPCAKFRNVITPSPN